MTELLPFYFNYEFSYCEFHQNKHMKTIRNDCSLGFHGFQRMVVSAIIDVTVYGSILDAGLRSSKYPFPFFSVSRPTLTDAPRFATPCAQRIVSCSVDTYCR